MGTVAPTTPEAAPTPSKESWAKISRHDPLDHPLFGANPAERIARGDPALLMTIGPLIEQLGVAVGHG